MMRDAIRQTTTAIAAPVMPFYGMITSIEGLALAQYRRNLPLFAAGLDRLRGTLNACGTSVRTKSRATPSFARASQRHTTRSILFVDV
jgi:hypothetical protein